MIVHYFGSPGCGKTTLACKLAKQARKRYNHIHLNFDNTVPDVTSCDLDGLGNWTFPRSSWIGMDELGIVYNSRKHKEFPKELIYWFKIHRHYQVDIATFSQGWSDGDKIIRDLSTQLWYMYRVGPWTLCRRVYKRVTVNKETEQIIDGYKMASALWLLIWPLQLGWPFDKKWTLTFRPFYYRYFDSWDTPDTQVKHFRIRNETKSHRRARLAGDHHNKAPILLRLIDGCKWLISKICAGAFLLYNKVVPLHEVQEDPEEDS